MTMTGETVVRTVDDETSQPGREESRPGLDDVVAGWVTRVVDLYPRPQHPVAEEWDASVQGLVRRVPYVPRIATAPLGLLDRFGAVTVGPQRVGLDGTDVDWTDVVEVRTEPAWTHLSAEALEANLAQYVGFLPPVPGRSWVLGKLSELLLSLYLAVLPMDDDLVPGTDRRDPARDLLLARPVTGLVHRRRFGQGEVRAGTASVLLQLALPESTDVLLRTAADRGVPVVHVPADESQIGSVVARAAQWRSAALGLRDRVRPRDAT